MHLRLHDQVMNRWELKIVKLVFVFFLTFGITLQSNSEFSKVKISIEKNYFITSDTSEFELWVKNNWTEFTGWEQG